MQAHVSSKSADFHSFRSASSQLWQRTEVLVWLLVFATICTDFAIVPLLNTVAPAFSCGLLVLLLVRRQPLPFESRNDAAIPFPENWRIATFLLLHAVVLGAARALQNGSSQITAEGTPTIVALAKYLILFPAIVLLPLDQWRKFVRLYGYECLAALVALLTFFPYRTFHALWPWYSQALGQAVFWTSRNIVPGLQLVPLASPVLTGPALDVVIIPDCGGLQAIKLFQILFALILVVDWDSLNKARTLVAYSCGLAAMLLLNVVRIALLVIVGNKWHPELIVRYHIIVSWMFPAAFLAVLLWIGYGRLFSSAKETLPSRTALVAQTAGHLGGQNPG